MQVEFFSLYTLKNGASEGLVVQKKKKKNPQ